MKRGRFYDPPFILKIVLLICLVAIGIAHKKGWMSRTMGQQAQQETVGQPAYELKPAVGR